MLKLKISIVLLTVAMLITSCKKRYSNNNAPIDFQSDTTYFGEYLYMRAIDEGTYHDTTAKINTYRLARRQFDGFDRLKPEERFKVIQLMRLVNRLVDYNCCRAIEFTASKDSFVNHLEIHPRGIYGKLPLKYVLAFDSLKSLIIPICPKDVGFLISSMTYLESIFILPQTTKPYVIDLSTSRMEHLKQLEVWGIMELCKGVTFPKENKLQNFKIANCNFSQPDSSWQYLRHLNALYLNNVFFQSIELDGLISLDTLSIMPVKNKIIPKNALRNLNNKTKVIIQKNIIEFINTKDIGPRELTSLEDSLHIKFFTAAGCD